MRFTNNTFYVLSSETHKTRKLENKDRKSKKFKYILFTKNMVEAKLVKGTMTRKILHDILDKELDKYLELLLKASPYEVTRTASEQSAIANFFLVGKVSDDVD